MDGIIFDVDGTLWDSTDTVAESWNTAIRENSSLDLVVDRQILSGLFGKTMEDLYRALFPQLSDEERTLLGTLCFEYENKLLLENPARFIRASQKHSKRFLKTTISILSATVSADISRSCWKHVI